MKLTSIAAAVGIMFLVLGNSALAAPPQGTSLTMLGGVVNPGSQSYSVRGGQLAGAWVLGTPLDLRNAIIHYSMKATVAGMSVSGVAQFYIKALISKGSHLEVNGTILIDGMSPAMLFPLGCSPGVDCTGAIPAFFNGSGPVTVSGEGRTVRTSLHIGIESPYLNPFGGALVIASSGGELVALATYDQGTIVWNGVEMGGIVSGVVSGTPTSGQFGMLVNSVEDLKSGIELDRGAISFFSMSVPAYDAAGTFGGVSKIPRSGGVPCPGFPAGTCFLTGLVSSGLSFQKTAGGMTLTGQYATTWTVPAVAFSSKVTGTLR